MTETMSALVPPSSMGPPDRGREKGAATGTAWPPWIRNTDFDFDVDVDVDADATATATVEGPSFPAPAG